MLVKAIDAAVQFFDQFGVWTTSLALFSNGDILWKSFNTVATGGKIAVLLYGL